jgi:hypothetical protein
MFLSETASKWLEELKSDVSSLICNKYTKLLLTIRISYAHAQQA